MNWITPLINSYYDFLKGKTSVITETGTNWVVISTPFIGLFNDTLDIYAKMDSANNKILLSDDGVTLKNLDLIGATISHSPKRKEIVQRILSNYDVQIDPNNEIVVQANESSFAQKKHNLITAISEINDLYVLSKSNVMSIFKEDVRGYLDEQNIIYTPYFISKGSVGIEFTFDFQIAYHKKEIVIKSFNSINKLNLPQFLFTWEDIRSARKKIAQKDVVGLAIINDSEKEVKSEYLEALKIKNTEYILWSEREKPENVAKLKEAA